MTESTEWTSPCGLTLRGVHEEAACVGRACVIHAPSDHSMREFPLRWRSDRGLMERICPHGVGHPDPDDLAFKATKMSPKGAWAEGVHGCCGCCRVIDD